MKRWLKRKNQDEISARRPSVSPSANVFSYYANRSTSETPASRKPSQKKSGKHLLSWRMLPSLLAMVAIIFSLGYVLVLDTNPKLIVLGSQEQAALLQTNETYRQAAESILRGSIANRTKLTINTDRVADSLKKRFPELETVAITVPLASHRLVLELEAVTPTLVLESKSGTYVVDAAGRAVVQTKDVPNLASLNLPRVKDESGLEIKVGQPVLPAEQIRFITDVRDQFNAKSLTIESMTLPAQANELRVRLTGEGYYVKFYMAGDARLQAGTFIAVREKLSKDGVKPAEYIDVRVPSKAFYK